MPKWTWRYYRGLHLKSIIKKIIKLDEGHFGEGCKCPEVENIDETFPYDVGLGLWGITSVIRL